MTAKKTPKTKKQTMIDLMKRKNGATMDDITKAIGWQAHSARAVISGLRKEGYGIETERTATHFRYRITKCPAQ